MLKVTAHKKIQPLNRPLGPSTPNAPPSSAETLRKMREGQDAHFGVFRRTQEKPTTGTTNAEPVSTWSTRQLPTNKRVGPSHARDVKTTFPRPSTKLASGSAAFKRWVNYWKTLTAEQKDRVIVYGYRKWPVIDRRLVNEKQSASIVVFRKTDDPQTSGDCPFASDQPEQDLLHLFGSGIYKFFLNEAGVPNAVTAVEITVTDNNYPPQLDLRELDRGHPSNASYIDGLRRRGIKLPWDDPDQKEKEEEEDMQSNAVAGQLAGTIANLADRLSAGHSNQPPSVEQQAIASGMSIVQQASTMGMEIIKAGIDSNQQKTDPIAMMTAIAELIGAKKGDDGMTVELMKQNADLRATIVNVQSESAKEMRGMMKEMMQMQVAHMTEREDTPPTKTELEVLKEAVEKKELFEKLQGGGSTRRRKEGDEENGDKASTIETVMKTLPLVVGSLATIFSMGASMLHNYTVLKTQGPPQPGQEPISPQPGYHPSPGLPQGQGQPIQPQRPPQTNQPPSSQAPIDPNTLTNPNGTQGDPEVLELLRAQQMLTAMQPALLAHYYGDGTDGTTFAHWIITQGTGANPTQEGRKLYEGLKEAGKDKLIFLFKSHPIWNDIGGTPQKTDNFLNTFFGYDEIMAAREMEDDGEDERDSTPTPN